VPVNAPVRSGLKVVHGWLGRVGAAAHRPAPTSRRHAGCPLRAAPSTTPLGPSPSMASSGGRGCRDPRAATWLRDRPGLWPWHVQHHWLCPVHGVHLVQHRQLRGHHRCTDAPLGAGQRVWATRMGRRSFLVAGVRVGVVCAVGLCVCTVLPSAGSCIRNSWLFVGQPGMDSTLNLVADGDVLFHFNIRRARAHGG
jgi:hypothetical protein